MTDVASKLIMYLINDQPFINFDQYNIDFDRLYYEITEFMIRHHYHLGSQGQFNDDPVDLVRFSNVVLTDIDIQRMDGLTPDQKQLYLKIVKKVYYPWNVYNLNMNNIGEWHRRQEPRTFLPETLQMMPYFVEMIEALPIFDNIGWARIYANEPFNSLHIHRDWSSNIELDQFVYFNLNNKRLFLKDRSKKIYPDGKAIFFDTANLHGTDPEPCYSFSLRVDGRFTKQFRSTLKCSRLNEGK